MTPVRLEPSAPWSRVKQSITESLPSLSEVVIESQKQCSISMFYNIHFENVQSIQLYDSWKCSKNGSSTSLELFKDTVSSGNFINYSKICVKPTLSKRLKMVFKTDYRLMQVKSIAECSKVSILQYFGPSSLILFYLILYVPSTIFQLNRNGSSWVEPVPS